MWNLLIVVWVPYFAYACDGILFLNLRFENDVKMYGTQTSDKNNISLFLFENDVNKKYFRWNLSGVIFENDVKMYEEI